MSTTQRTATAAEWAALEKNVSPGNRQAFLSGGMPVYEDKAGTMRLWPPGTILRDLPPAEVVTKAPSTSARPETSEPTSMRVAAPPKPVAKPASEDAAYQKLLEELRGPTPADPFVEQYMAALPAPREVRASAKPVEGNAAKLFEEFTRGDAAPARTVAGDPAAALLASFLSDDEVE